MAETREISRQIPEIKIPRWLAEAEGLPTCVYQVNDIVTQKGGGALLNLTPVAHASEHCHRCGKKIDHPVSRQIGFGPVCCEKLGLSRPSGVAAEKEANEWLKTARQVLSEMVIETWIPKKYLKGLPGITVGNPPAAEMIISTTPKSRGQEMVAVSFNDLFKQNKGIVNTFKNLFSDWSDREYDRESYRWLVKPTAVTPELLTWLDDQGFVIDDGTHDLLKEKAEEAPAASANPRVVTFDGGGRMFFVQWPNYDKDFNAIKSIVKDTPARRFTKEDPKGVGWYLPCYETSVETINYLVDRFGFVLDAGIQEKMDEIAEVAEEVTSLSESTEAVDLGELDLNGNEMMPFQTTGVAYATKMKRTFIGDEMGLGKTVQAIVSTIATQQTPIVVVAPATAKINWEREYQKWTGFTTEILQGRNGKAAGRYDADVTILNYDILSDGWTKIEYRDKNNKKRTRKVPKLSTHVQKLMDRGIGTLIFDESHMVKNEQAQRSKAAEIMATDVENVYMLSGTVQDGKPVELVQQLRIMRRLEDFGGWKNFVYRYCDAYKGRWGMVYGSSNELELNERLRATCFIRRLKKDVLAELPDKRHGRVYMDITNKEEYRRAEENLISWIRQQARTDEEFLNSISHLSDEEQAQAVAAYASDKAARADRAEHLVRFSALRKLIARGKLQNAIAWVDDVTNPDRGNEKLVLFAIHNETIDALRKAFPDAAYVISSQNAEQKQANVDRFQNDPNCKLFIGALGTHVSASPAGVAITLTAASNVAFLEFGWTPGLHAQGADRCHRIGQKNAVNVYWLVAEETIDDTMEALIQKKQAVNDKVLDGKADSGSDTADIMGDLVKDLLSR